LHVGICGHGGLNAFSQIAVPGDANADDLTHELFLVAYMNNDERMRTRPSWPHHITRLYAPASGHED
jgi:hypothetical protein